MLNQCSILNLKKKINILDLNKKMLKKFFISIGEKSFRAEQVMKGIYQNYYNNFDSMTDLNKFLRIKLNKIAEINSPKLSVEKISSDGTIKWIIAINDQEIETIYIPEKKRATLCLSSQVGCILKCDFCLTGKKGFNRNLKVSEIVGQVLLAKKIINLKRNYNLIPITNIVFMGMGEPLLNLKNVISAIDIMTDNFGFGFSKKKITISTSGIVPAINKLGKEKNISLAISLHAPNDFIRNKIMPINKKYNIQSLLSAAKKYLNLSTSHKNYITIEYVMLNRVNDEIEHAYELVKKLKNLSCKINLIPWNSFPSTSYQRSSNFRINQFIKVLKKYNFIVTIRKSRGEDINAACGQLSGKVNNRFKKK